MIKKLLSHFTSQLLIALLMGVLLTFAFAPYEIFPLAILIPCALLYIWLLHTNNLKRSFWLGYFFGLGFFGAGVSWVFISIHVIGGVIAPLAMLITAAFIAILSLYPALTGFLLNRYFPINHLQKMIFAFPAIWVVLEWVRSIFFTGFPWLFLGYSQTDSPLKGYAPLLSVYGVSLAVLMSSGLCLAIFNRYRAATERHFFSMLSDVAKPLSSLILIWVIGGLLCLIPWTKPDKSSVSVALVQGNIPQTMKWSDDQIQLSLDRYEHLTRPLLGKTDVIIWPETAIPVPLPEELASNYVNALDDLLMESHTNLLTGIPIALQGGETGFYNALVSLGEKKQVYTKRHLVPFGEYTPFSDVLNKALQFMQIPMSDMVAGKFNQMPMQVGRLTILPSICYEIAFPEIIRNPDPFINAIVVVTNDAWFGHSNAEAQHLQMAAMRAIEFRKPVLFVSNDGITAIIGANGHIEKRLPQQKAAVLRGEIMPRTGITPWLKNGSDPIIFLIIYFILTALYYTHSHGRSKTPFRLNPSSINNRE